MRLLCDEMLSGLGRWLRAAGYDTAVAERGSPDQEVLRRARAEGRLLLTRDRALAGRCAPEQVVLLEAVGIEGWAAELLRFGVDWEYRPFSRCLMCNLALHPASPPLPEVPQDRRGGPVLRCPGCGRHYWEGSHVARMRRRLRQLNHPGEIID